MAVMGAESRAKNISYEDSIFNPGYLFYLFLSILFWFCFFISHMENGTNIRGAGFSRETLSADET